MYSTFYDSEIDLEELETYMYGQFYHSNEEYPQIDVSSPTSYSSSMQTRGRYFENQHQNIQQNYQNTPECGSNSTLGFKEYETPLMWSPRINSRNLAFNQGFPNYGHHSQNYNSNQPFLDQPLRSENYNRGVTNYNREIINYNSGNVGSQVFHSNYMVQSFPQASSQMFVPPIPPNQQNSLERQQAQLAPTPSSSAMPPNYNNFNSTNEFQGSRRQRKNRKKTKLKQQNEFKVHNLIHTVATKKEQEDKESDVVYLSDISDCVAIEQVEVPVVISSGDEDTKEKDVKPAVSVQASISTNDVNNDDDILILEVSNIDVKKSDAKEKMVKTNDNNNDNIETSNIKVLKGTMKEKLTKTNSPPKLQNNDDVLILETSGIEGIILNDSEDFQESIKNDETLGVTKENIEIAESTLSNDFLDTSLEIAEMNDPTCSHQSHIANMVNTDSNSSSDDATDTAQSIHFNENTLLKTPFSELNLDTFRDYISPKSSTSRGNSLIPANFKVIDEFIEGSPNNLQRYSSDSSSESDYEDKKVDVETYKKPAKKPRLEEPTGKVKKEKKPVKDVIKDEEYNKAVELPIVTDLLNIKKDIIKDEEYNKAAELPIVTDLLNIDCKNTTVNSSEEAPRKKWKSFSDYWNDDIVQFYTQDWEQDNFDLKEEQKKMSDDPNMWRVIKEDQVNLKALPWKIRCRRCKNYGHRITNCSQPRQLQCNICGGKHLHTRCPNCLCTSCGDNNLYYTTCCRTCRSALRTTCSLCFMPDHNLTRCPDLWRRYHLTTKIGPLVQPKSKDIKPIRDRWCSGCGDRGHFEQNCHRYYRLHGVTDIAVQSYEEVYGSYQQGDYKPNQNKSEENTNAESTSFVINEKMTDNCPLEDLPEDEKQLISWNIMATDANILLSEYGIEFLKKISKKEKLNIKIFLEPFNNITRFKCSIEGPRKAYNEKGAIERFCRTQIKHININKITLEDLQRNMEQLNNSDYSLLNITKHLLTKISVANRNLKRTRRKKRRLLLEETLLGIYVHINSVLIGKFKIGDGKRHMEVLEKWQTNVEQFDDEFKQSYKYVFLNNEPIINYKDVVDKLILDSNITFPKQFKKITNQSILSISEMDILKMYDFMISTCKEFYWTGLMRKVKAAYSRVQRKWDYISLKAFDGRFKHIKRISLIEKRKSYTK